MGYKYYDIHEQEIRPKDLQNKNAWCEKGARYEKSFVQIYGEALGLTRNPEKQTNDFAPDLINTKQGGLADLKTQRTPFFLSQMLYKIDPQYAVTFNEGDYIRYQQKYSGIEVYFWIDWQAVRFNGSNSSVKVLPMQGVWLITYNNMLEAVKKAPLHTYSQRVNDKQGNAKRSFILDLSSTYFSKIA